MEELIKLVPTTGLKILPHWLAQPYFRVQSTSFENMTKKELKRMNASDARRESEDKGEGEDEGEGEKQSESRQEDAKRVKLATFTAVPLSL